MVLAITGALLLSAREPGPRLYVLGGYATDLARRTPHQRFNARRAASLINGATIPPGTIFSFNRRVRGWSGDQGYLPAPVSYDGALVDAYGGGVCETSSTLYNAALLAGLPILERHPHSFAPGYVQPGRDAAVAWPGVDLRFRNPYRFPLTLHVEFRGSMLICRITAPESAPIHASVSTRILARLEAAPERLSAHPRRGSNWRLEGKPGLRVVVLRRLQSAGKKGSLELVSDDCYLPLAPLR